MESEVKKQKKAIKPTDSQKKAINSAKKKVIVTASAGAGKTATMISRLIRLIKEGVPLSSVVMLTFTKAAAAEMKTRLSDALYEGLNAAQDLRLKKIFVQALDVLPLFSCSTIDSFCYTLVKRHFELLDLSPNTTLMDDNDVDAYMQSAFKSLMQEFFESEEKEYFTLLSDFQNKEKDLSDCIKKLYKYAETTEDGDAFLQKAEEIARKAKEDVDQTPAIKDLCRRIRAQAATTRERVLALAFSPQAKIPEVNRAKVLDALEKHMTGSGLRDFAAARSFSFSQVKAPERLDIDDQDNYKKLQEIYADFKKRSGVTFNDKSIGDVLKAQDDENEKVLLMIRLTRRFKEIYSRLKQESRLMDFMDVEHDALTLLRDHDGAREIGCEYLLVDECQDLNPLQDTLMQLIVGGNHLFMVGDVKQSIYRFRLSDPLLFRRRIIDAKEDEAGAEVIDFAENFRSSTAVVDFVNTVFSGLMTREFGGEEYLPSLRGALFPEDGSVRRRFKNEPNQETSPIDSVYSVKEAAEKAAHGVPCEEGEWVRDCILELVGKSYVDTKKGETKTLTYKDIAILSTRRMKSGNQQEKIVNVLRRAGIPLNVGNFVKEKDHVEIHAIVDFLKLIESPNDDAALLSVLRSDMFGFSLERISEIAFREGESFVKKAQAGAAAGEEDLKAFFDYLEEMRLLSGAFSLYELVSRLIDQKMRLPVLKRVDGRQVFGELLTFAETLKSGNGTSSVSEFLAYFRDSYVIPEEGEVAESDAVNVMSVHASKGLEFPVVFVIGLGEEIVSNKSDTDRLRVDKEYGVSMNLSQDSKKITPYVYQFKCKKKEELKEDRLRLLYVALTRAKNYLFLSGTIKGEEDNSPDSGSDEGATPLSEGYAESKTAPSPDEKVAEASEGAASVALKEKKTEYTLPPKEEAKTITEWILGALKETPYSSETNYLPRETRKSAQRKKEVTVDQKAVAALRKGLESGYPHAIATQTGIKFTVTAINESEREEKPYAEIAQNPFPEDARMKGTAFHAAMEHLPFTVKSVRETTELLDLAVEDGLMDRAERETLNDGSVFEAIREVAALAGNGKVYREKSFLLRIPAREAGVADIEDPVIVQGKIDLLIVNGESAVVVDYKLSDASEKTLKERYGKQLDLYAKAVRKGFSVTDVKKYIFVLGRNKAIAID